MQYGIGYFTKMKSIAITLNKQRLRALGLLGNDYRVLMVPLEQVQLETVRKKELTGLLRTLWSKHINNYITYMPLTPEQVNEIDKIKAELIRLGVYG